MCLNRPNFDKQLFVPQPADGNDVKKNVFNNQIDFISIDHKIVMNTSTSK